MNTFDIARHLQSSEEVLIVFVIEQTSQPKLDVFQELLSKQPGVFHPSRTPKSLLVHWQLLKQYYLLDDQSGMLNCQHIYSNKMSKLLGIYFVFIWANIL